jgi:porin
MILKFCKLRFLTQARIQSTRFFRAIVLITFSGLIIFNRQEAFADTTNSPTNTASAPLTDSPDTNAVGLFTAPMVFWDTPPDLRPFQLVLPNGRILGDWFGLIPLLDSNGISPSINFVSDVAGNPVGGKSQGITHADNLGVNVDFDLNKLAGIPGASFLASMSVRDGNSLSHDRVGNIFTIQQDYGGDTIKLLDLAYKQQLFDDRVEFQAGRLAAGDDFLVSPYNWVFMQNAIDGNPVGIFFNSPGMTAYPNSAWGTVLKVRPTPRTYVMGGVYDGDPNIRGNDHNGADMSMHGPVFAIMEAAYQKNGLPGDAGLIGNYRVGAWYDNSSYEDFRTVGNETPVGYQRGNWGLYTLVDQVILAFGDRSRNSGLGLTGSALVSPNQTISQLPYFFTAGVVARGFLSSRPTDLAGFGVDYGEFSDRLRQAEEREQLFTPAIGAQNNETVLELTYRFNFAKDAILFQPDIQYIIKPGGTGNIQNALVLGFQFGFNL